MDELYLKLFSKLKENNIKFNEKRIIKAYEFARKAHSGQIRGTGEPYINHPVEAAIILSRLNVDEHTIIAALLHDVVEDTNTTKEEIIKHFGEDVYTLVDGVTKLRRTHLKSENEKDIENLKKLILASTKDIRILLIKLSDRLHNARTIAGLPTERQASYAKELLKVFAPLSEYLGVGIFQKEFEDIGFRYTHPEEYKKISSELNIKKDKREDTFESFVKNLKKLLKKHEIKADIESREKSSYSIYKKIKKKTKEKSESLITIDDLFDLLAVRIIVDDVSVCYQTLGIIHQAWTYIPEEFDDYISKPKPNGYRSLHTVLDTSKWGYIEIQIRTKEMHEFNEYGPAAHIAYKKSGERDAKATDKFKFVKNLVKWQKANKATNANGDYELDLFKENIFVFTPEGALIELPFGSTPIDFAYHIHTNVGDNCIGVKVNGTMSDLSYILKMGDLVEILVSKSKKFPKRDWLELAYTVSTRTKIRRGLREKEEFESREIGKNLLNNVLREKYKLGLKDIEGDLIKNINSFKVSNIEELYARIGFGFLNPETVIKTIIPEKQENKKKATIIKPETKSSKILIAGHTDLQYELAKCCDPKMGDLICGYLTSEHRTKIHKINCSFLNKHKDKSKILTAEWVF